MITVYQKDLNRINDIKTIYEIEIIDYHGLSKIKKIINVNKYIIIFVLIALSVIIFLSHLVFEIEVVTNDLLMKDKLIRELKKNGIDKYKFKKNYQHLQTIKKRIKSKYQHEIDWIEIENIGTKYIVRYEPRIENKKTNNYPYRNIIAKKNALIYKLDIKDGEILKTKDSYVSKGDVIVSGYIHLNDQVKDTVSATGKVYGEVWYTLNIKYPLEYYSESKTGKKKKILVLKILNKNIELFNIHKYKTKTSNSKTILKNNLLPFKLEQQHQYETIVIDKKYNPQEALKQAIKEGKKKLRKKLKKDEFIIYYKVLTYNVADNMIKAKIFYTVCEDITDYQTIEEYKEENNEINN